MEKKYCYEYYENQTIEERNAQIAYLRYVESATPTTIGKYIDLALTTIRSYIYKVVDLIELGKKLFTNVKVGINYEIQEDKHCTCSYVLELKEKSTDNSYLKVGKAKDLAQRMKGLKKDYYSIVVKKVFEFSNENIALQMEDYLRKLCQDTYPNTFFPKDRFYNVEFESALFESEKVQNVYNDLKQIEKLLIDFELKYIYA